MNSSPMKCIFHKPQAPIIIMAMFVIFTSRTAYTQVIRDIYPQFKFTWPEKYKPETRNTLKADLEEILQLQSEIQADDKLRIKYWNAAYPGYRWHQIMMDISAQHQGHKNGGRVAILHLAIYDATTGIWPLKEKYPQLAPFRWSREIIKYGREPEYSNFICEWSAAAGEPQRK